MPGPAKSNITTMRPARPAAALTAPTNPAAPGEMQIGQNVAATVDGHFLYLRVDLSQPGVDSSTGKTKLVGHTSGAVALLCERAGLKVSVLVTVPNRG